MAVENKYIDSNVAAGKPANPAKHSGAQTYSSVITFEVAAADTDLSVYRVIKGIPANWIPQRITVMCDAITGGTDYDVGLYLTNLGAEVDKNCLADALDLSSASKILDGLKDVAIENRVKRLWELAGHTEANKQESYDLALTGNTVGSAAGTITLIAEFVQA